MTSKPDALEIAHPSLVIKTKLFGGAWALPVTRKGPYMTNAVKRVMHVINSIGSPKVIIKTDQEPAMISMQQEIGKE